MVKYHICGNQQCFLFPCSLQTLKFKLAGKYNATAKND